METMDRGFIEQVYEEPDRRIDPDKIPAQLRVAPRLAGMIEPERINED